MEISHLAFNIQVLCIPLVTVLLWQLTRAVTGRFLMYWTVGWLVLAAALLSLRLSLWADENDNFAAARLAFSFYCCLEYAFGFFLWAGCRALTKGTPLWRDAWVLAPPLAFGLVAPWLLKSTDHAYIYHSPIFGMFFLLALSATRGYRADAPGGVEAAPASHPSFGIYVVRGCRLILGVLFIHYCPVTCWAVWLNDSR